MKVIEVAIGKRGMKKNGEPYTQYRITLEDGRKASGFDFVRVGDDVVVEQKGQYLNYALSDGAVSYPEENEQTSQKPPQSSGKGPSERSNDEDAEMATRKHIMQSCNLLSLCIDAVDKNVAPHVPEIAKTEAFFQAQVASVFIEANGRRTTDGVHWWSYVDKMPTTPLKKSDEEVPF